MNWLKRATRWAERHQDSALGALVGFYLAIVLVQASLKLVWADELITFYVARQPGLAGVWRALQAGADPNPPLMHLLVKASSQLFGADAIAMRAPAIACVLLAILAMWWMLRRWVSPAFAVAGVLVFMATRGFDYAYDARSYAPLMGFAMASLALWIWAGDLEGWRRIGALACLSLALAAGLSSNYYGVLAFFPIAAGELAARRLRIGVWIAMAFASLPLFAYLPLIRHNLAEFVPHAWNPPRLSMIGMSYLALVEGILWPVLGFAVYLLWTRRKTSLTVVMGVPRAEAVALGVLLLYPVIGLLIAVGGAGIISPRCVVPVCCGVGLIAGVLANSTLRGSSRAGWAVVLALVVWVTVREGICGGLIWQQRREFQPLVAGVANLDGPVLVGDSLLVLPLYFYSDPVARRKIVFPVDFNAIHRYEADDSGEQNLWAGRHGVFPFPVVALDDVRFGRYTPARRVPVELRIPPVVPPRCWSDLTVLARPGGWLASGMRRRGFQLAEDDGYDRWEQLGGVFTSLAHFETRIQTATHPCTAAP